uniref:Bm7460 n=1 Tax=Brugia malayi TaxID=6279 RepID=A0A1I9GEA5_BRUMA|nr:Bm7460 [Brugia malayi]
MPDIDTERKRNVLLPAKCMSCRLCVLSYRKSNTVLCPMTGSTGGELGKKYRTLRSVEFICQVCKNITSSFVSPKLKLSLLVNFQTSDLLIRNKTAN